MVISDVVIVVLVNLHFSYILLINLLLHLIDIAVRHQILKNWGCWRHYSCGVVFGNKMPKDWVLTAQILARHHIVGICNGHLVEMRVKIHHLTSIARVSSGTQMIIPDALIQRKAV